MKAAQVCEAAAEKVIALPTSHGTMPCWFLVIQTIATKQ
jgi:hypothetical protein